MNLKCKSGNQGQAKGKEVSYLGYSWTKKEPCPHMHQVKGRQMSVLTGACSRPWITVASLSHIPGARGVTIIDTHPQRRVLMWKFRFSQEKFQHSMGERRIWVWTHELGNRNGSTLPTLTSSTRKSSLRLIENFSAPPHPDFFHRGNGECVNDLVDSPAVWDLPKGPFPSDSTQST